MVDALLIGGPRERCLEIFNGGEGVGVCGVGVLLGSLPGPD